MEKSMNNDKIQICQMEHLQRYGELYADAFSGEPWHDPWRAGDAEVHVREILESAQSYGLEYLVDGEVAGIILGNSTLFHSGRTFDIHDLAVDPKYQKRGIATKLLEQCLSDLKAQGMKSVSLMTAAEGALPSFYERFGFKKQNAVALMGKRI